MAEGSTKPINIDPDTLKLVQDLLNKGSTGTGAISAPQGQGALAIKDDNYDPKKPIQPDPAQPGDNYPLIGGATGLPSPNAAAKPSTAQAAHFGSDATGYWIADPTAPNGVTMVVPPHTPNADEEMKKALDRMDTERQIGSRQRNEATTGLYVDDEKLANLQHLRATDKVAADRLEFDIKSNAAKQKNDDLEQANRNKAASDALLTSAASRGLTGAQTARTGAETAQIQQGVERTGALLPGEITQQGLTAEGTAASTAGTQASTARTQQQILQGNAPTVQAPQTGMYQYQRDPNTGVVSATGINQEYIPKTQAEIAARGAQIKSVMDAKQQELMGKVGENYSTDQAFRDFSAWHAQAVQPHIAELQAAADEAAFQRGKDQAAMRTSAYTSALGAGTQAINAENAMTSAGLHQVGPGFAAGAQQAMQGKAPDLASTFSVDRPSIGEQAQQATQEALKYIDPRAAAAAGAPPPTYMNQPPQDFAAMLGARPYVPPGVSAPPPPPAPAPTPEPVAAAAPPPLLAPGAAGVPGMDPRLAGQLNPMQWTPAGGSDYTNAGPPPWLGAQAKTLLQQFGTANPWEIAPPYSFAQ